MREVELAAMTDPTIKQYIEEQHELTLSNWSQIRKQDKLPIRIERALPDDAEALP